MAILDQQSSMKNVTQILLLAVGIVVAIVCITIVF
jgi:hypothetical protein